MRRVVVEGHLQSPLVNEVELLLLVVIVAARLVAGRNLDRVHSEGRHAQLAADLAKSRTLGQRVDVCDGIALALHDIVSLFSHAGRVARSSRLPAAQAFFRHALGGAQPAASPEQADCRQQQRHAEGGQHLDRIALQEAAHRLEHKGDRIERRRGLDPSGEQVVGDPDGREEEQQEHRHLHGRSGLHGAQPHGHAGGEQHGSEVEQHRQRVEPEQINRPAAHVQARDQRHHRDQRDREQRADQGREPVAGHDAAAIGRGEHEPPREAGLEVAGHRKAGEDAAEHRGL